MNTKHLILTAVFLAAAWASAAAADPNAPQYKPRPPLGNNPHPIIWHSPSSRPATPAPKPPTPMSSPSKSVDHADHDRTHHDFDRSSRVSGGYYWYPGGTYGCDSHYGYGYPYSYAPVYVSSEDLYGPRAMQRFMGADNVGTSWTNVNVIAPPAIDNARVDAPEPEKAVERATNAQAKTLARKFIKFGDAQFAEQKFGEANQRYRKAAQSAPQLADAWFRQGFALAALGRYDRAAEAIRRGLTFNPNWGTSGFNLNELYGADQLAKNSHLDALAQAAVDKPNDAHLLFLVGVYLHFDGQAERAEKFFRRALELAAGDEEHIRAFLKK